MGLSGDTFVVLRDTYSKKISIYKLENILDIDIKNHNFEIWSNIGWVKITAVKESINFNPLYSIESSCGFIKISGDCLNNVVYCNPNSPKTNNRNDRWHLNNDEAFLLGYFLKYGMLDNRFNLIIQDTHPECKHLKKFLQIFDKVESVKSTIIENNTNKCNYIIKNIYDKLIWNKYFNFCYDLQFNKIIPNVILNSNENVQIAFLLGYLGELNYRDPANNKKDPLKHLMYVLKTRIVTTKSKQLFAGLYIVLYNVLNDIIDLNLSLGSFIKDKTKYYYITTSENKDKNEKLSTKDKNSIKQINSTNTKTYDIIPQNNYSVDWIAVGIGQLAYNIK